MNKTGTSKATQDDERRRGVAVTHDERRRGVAATRIFTAGGGECFHVDSKCDGLKKNNNDSRTEALSCVLHVTILCAVVASRRRQKRRRASVEQVVRARNEGWHGVPWCLYSRMRRCSVSGRRLARWTPDVDLVCVARFSPCGQRLGSVCMTVSMLS